jgi:hypothetical protein
LAEQSIPSDITPRLRKLKKGRIRGASLRGARTRAPGNATALAAGLDEDGGDPTLEGRAL